MNIYWVTDCAIHLNLLGTTDFEIGLGGVYDVPIASNNIDVVVVYANAGSGRRTMHLGLKWLLEFRREGRSNAPAVIYSFESRDVLVREFSMLEPSVAGVRFLRLPFGSAELEEALKDLAQLTEEETNDLARWHSGLQAEWHGYAHSFSNSIKDWPHSKLQTEKLFAEWATSVRRFAPDQITALEILYDTLGQTPDCIRAAAQELEDRLCSRLPSRSTKGKSTELAAAPYDRPPRGYSVVAIADDQGYERSTINRLKQMGYDVAEPAANLCEAQALLECWRPQVVLVDLHFPTKQEGRELMRFALDAESVRLVIATSHSRAFPDELPDLVEDCCGATDFQNAERIHQLVWRRAQSEGVNIHA